MKADSIPVNGYLGESVEKDIRTTLTVKQLKINATEKILISIK